MPDYQAVTNPLDPHDPGRNPYITKHFRKRNVSIGRKKLGTGDRGDSTTSPPLLRDLLIMREGIRSIKGYKELSGESEQETAESTLDTGPPPLDLQTEVKPLIKGPGIPYQGPAGFEPMPRPGMDASVERGVRRGRQFSPRELELLRKAMLLIKQQGN